MAPPQVGRSLPVTRNHSWAGLAISERLNDFRHHLKWAAGVGRGRGWPVRRRRQSRDVTLHKYAIPPRSILNAAILISGGHRALAHADDGHVATTHDLNWTKYRARPPTQAENGWLCFPARPPYDGVTCFVPDGSKPLPEASKSASESAKPVLDTAAKPDGSALKLAWWTMTITGSAGWVTALGSIGFRAFGRRTTAVPPSSAPPPDSSAALKVFAVQSV